MNGSPGSAGLCVGILVALGLGACGEVDHPVGAAKDDPIDASGGSANGTGGSAASGNGASGSDGGSSGALGNEAWGDLPIPESCTPVARNTGDGECELEVKCTDEWAVSHCLEEADFLECTCLGMGDDVWYRMDRPASSDACTEALALCFQWPKHDAGSYECNETDNELRIDFCYSDATCTREGVLGDQAFTEFHYRTIDCSDAGPGFSCACSWPTTRRFEGATAMPDCAEARDWCAGVGVETSGSPDCTATLQPPEEDSPEDTCWVDIACERAATVSGKELTMYDDTWVACNPSGKPGRYECRCSEDPDTTSVDAEDANSACMQAAGACHGS